jgi:hypothetical protein
MWQQSGSYDGRLRMSGKGYRDRFTGIKKRNFRNSLIKLLEDDYKILGSRKILEMLADDIEDLHREFHHDAHRVGIGEVLWRVTKDDGQRQSYGKKAEDYSKITVKLPLFTEEDIEQRIYYKKGDKNSNYRHQRDRDTKRMVRLVKSGKEQGGLLTGADLATLLNRALATIGKCLKEYQSESKEILPLMGYVLDQGSLPTHKGIIISLYEQGMSPADIVLSTHHSQASVDRYITHYEQIKKLYKRGLDEQAIKSITGRSLKVVREHIKLYKELNQIP